MDKLYQMIEQKLREADYTGEIDVREFHQDICATAEGQPNGTDTFIVEKSDKLSYHICMTIYNFGEDFDLHYVDIYDGDFVYHVDWESGW